MRGEQNLDPAGRILSVLDPDVGENGEVLGEPPLVLGAPIEQGLDLVAMHVRSAAELG